MKLLVGLGNPGPKYARNRHNIGFMAVERIADRHRIGPWKKKFQGYAADGEVAGHKVMLLKPETFMNDSGRAVGEACRFLKIAIGDVIVLHDELDLEPGKLRIKVGGGNAGHNGLRSISALVGNDYQRVRIGIGHPGAKELVHGYVLHDFAKAEAVWLEPLLDAMAQSAERLATGDGERFLTDVARELGQTGARASGAKLERLETKPPVPAADAPRLQPRAAGHPAGERQSKRQSALTDNLKRWLGARRTDDT